MTPLTAAGAALWSRRRPGRADPDRCDSDNLAYTPEISRKRLLLPRCKINSANRVERSGAGSFGTAPIVPEIGALSVLHASLSLVNPASDGNGRPTSGRRALEPPEPFRATTSAVSRGLRQGAARSTSTGARGPVAKLLDRQHGVLSHNQAVTLGIGMSAIAYKIQPGGPWQRIFPGVYVTERSAPTIDQLDMAALLYARSSSLLTGRAALRRYGILPTATGIVDVLVPVASRLADRSYVRLHRTRRMPATFFRQGAIRFTAIPRAITDAALGAPSVRDMRAIVCVGVDRGRCTLQDLAAELGQSRLRNSAQLRAVIEDVARGIRSGPEGDLMDLIDRSDLPTPLYNPRLYLGDAFVAMPDAWWEAHGVAAEVDSREYHFEEADWENTMQRDARMTAIGIRVLHFTPRRIRAEPDLVIATIRRTLQIGAPVSGIRTVPSD
jgi:hypothetical protein